MAAIYIVTTVIGIFGLVTAAEETDAAVGIAWSMGSALLLLASVLQFLFTVGVLGK